MISEVIEFLKSNYEVSQKNVGKYALIKKNMMKFDISSYDVKGIGSFSYVKMSGMFGLIKMDSLIFTPLCVDAPLWSIDRMAAMGNDILYIEAYDLTLETGRDYPSIATLKEKYSYLPNVDRKEYWFQNLIINGTITKKGKKLSAEYNKVMKDYCEAFVKIMAESKPCEVSEKRKPVQEYVDGLFEKGSPTVEQFTKLMDKAETKDMYERFIFSSK
ncbi:MAG: hypothetical protein MJ236_02380 [Clostridia bacterium]|nr:hypothetical protein [Clostridia bacterium]